MGSTLGNSGSESSDPPFRNSGSGSSVDPFEIVDPDPDRGMYFAKYYGWGDWEKNGAGKKKKNESVRNKMKKKGKGKRTKEKGVVIFFVHIWHTFVDNCILT